MKYWEESENEDCESDSEGAAPAAPDAGIQDGEAQKAV